MPLPSAGQIAPSLIASLASLGWAGGSYQGVNPIHALCWAVDSVGAEVFAQVASSSLWIPAVAGVAPPLVNAGGSILLTAPLNPALPPVSILLASAIPSGTALALSAGWAGPQGLGGGIGALLGLANALATSAAIFTADPATQLIVAAGPSSQFYLLQPPVIDPVSLQEPIATRWRAQPGMESASVDALLRTSAVFARALATTVAGLAGVASVVGSNVSVPLPAPVPALVT